MTAIEIAGDRLIVCLAGWDKVRAPKGGRRPWIVAVTDPTVRAAVRASRACHARFVVVRVTS